MKNLSATKFYALAFGLFLGLCIWKFGNPAILDHKITPPASFAEFWDYAWPLHWANWILLGLSVIGGVLIFQEKPVWSQSKWLWLLPLIWLGWQFISATRSVDDDLTTATLWQFSGCVARYFLGALIFTNRTALNYLLIGILAAFAFCLVRAVDQKLFEFPLNHQMLVEGERSGWTNFPPEAIVEMKHDGVIISTNGNDMANPAILDKFKKGRVAGTLVYPNALAGLILLLSPLSLALAFSATRNFKPLIRLATVTLAIFLCAAAFFWTGSKLGWLIGIGMAGIFLLRMNWPKKIKIVAMLVVLVSGFGIFGIRFHHYFATGATSASARLDYWHAAVQTTLANPVFGSGPGTFQRPYARLKSPESEMARLTHNDYLEQFSDSGIVGGLTYLTWIGLTLSLITGRFWQQSDKFYFAVLAGLTAWFAQGFGEFSLYIPALAWTAFTLLGCLIGSK